MRSTPRACARTALGSRCQTAQASPPSRARCLNTNRFRRSAGFTLLELTIYVAILSLTAAIVVPNISATNLGGLELAAVEVADAFRFAREQTRRSENRYGVTVDTAGNLIRVFRLDESVTPNIKVYDVYHPLSKQPYEIKLDRAPYHRVAVNSYGGTPSSTCNDLGSFAFDRHGLVRCTNPATSRIRNATAQLAVDNHLVNVAIEAMTGRVTSQ